MTVVYPVTSVPSRLHGLLPGIQAFSIIILMSLIRWYWALWMPTSQISRSIVSGTLWLMIKISPASMQWYVYLVTHLPQAWTYK